jgi:hypothetical protein
MSNYLSAFIVKFKHVFYVDNNTYVGDLCQEILRYCNFASSDIRAEAAAFLYSMIKHNHQEVGNIVRMNIQATNGLSQLASDGRLKKDTHWFSSALSTIPEYALEDYAKPVFDLGTGTNKRVRILLCICEFTLFRLRMRVTLTLKPHLLDKFRKCVAS